MKILIIGSKGMLGSDLVLEFRKNSHAVVEAGHLELDIRQKDSVEEFIQRERPDWVLLTAAFTGVDECETQKNLAWSINAEGPYYVASACRSVGAKLCYISTDYIFNGEKTEPYCEEDIPDPLNVYAETKLKGEIYVKQSLEKFLIVRTSWLFGTYGRNFVNTILEKAKARVDLKVVDDQVGSPTYTRDLATAIATLIEKNVNGLINITNAGSCSWYGFARRILDFAGFSEINIQPITSQSLKLAARRPANSKLSTDRFREISGCSLRAWQEALKEYLKTF